MNRLHERLAQLDPPVRHELERRSDGLLITLIEADHNVRVSRLLKADDMREVEQVNLILLHAINELRRKGAQVPLDKDTILLTRLPGAGVGTRVEPCG
ncbi:hypothetical protein QE444_003029 [Pseudomonas sp. SORGH_AS199]|jgi:hypothetical protein|uniref:DUF3509 domain-containing protein n=1 Tax=Pseudomonas oryzihabitans TaxID=47885 RepID=A0A2Z5ABF0_9PSED|nr:MULTISPECIES: hypothetical protein [Pseudomonas]AXA67226.1 hypothetical protein CE139_15850 [Pseudomonas oryzihabitans]MDR6230672.1 hypothetical protein [Pseudomonas sp. SORGH_AS_0199]QNQ99648.1 hypothetical protein BGI51_19475 [Pseudomonas psychrotolerans]